MDEIVRSVHRAYDDVLPGLPYPELPVIVISGASCVAWQVRQMIYQGIGSSTSQGFIANVASRLEANPVEESEDEDPPPSSYITHLYPSGCSNIMSTMKTLVTGFVDRPPAGQDGETVVIIPDISRAEGVVLPVKRKPTTSLSNYDIELLKVWHGVLRDAAGRLYVYPWDGCDINISEGPEPPPQLVVFLHEFEQFDQAVVQDLFYICRQARIS